MNASCIEDALLTACKRQLDTAPNEQWFVRSGRWPIARKKIF